ncbi:MAG: hypothetical protein DCC68_24430, partial [Planctomycetota bacterium]
MPPTRLFAIADDAPDGASHAQLAALAANLDAERFSLKSAILCASATESKIGHPERTGIPRITTPAPSPQSPAPVPRSTRWSIDPRAVWQLRRLVLEASPDVVLTIGEVAAVDGRLAAVLAGCKRIVACWPSVDFDFLGSIAHLDRWLMRHTSKFVLASDAERDAAIDHGWPPERLAVVPIAVAPLVMTLAREAAFRPLSIPPESPVIAVVSPWSPRHRVKEAIWGFDLLRAVRRDAHMIVAGEGPERADLEAFRDSQECQHAIHFVGPSALPDEWLAHAGVLWSLDPGPRVAYATWRAAASGVPVVAVDSPAHRAFIVPNATGLIVPGAVRP